MDATRRDTGHFDLEKFPTGTIAIVLPSNAHGSITVRVVADLNAPARIGYEARYWGFASDMPALLEDRTDDRWTLYPLGRPGGSGSEKASSSSSAHSGGPASLIGLLFSAVKGTVPFLRTEVVVTIPESALVHFVQPPPASSAALPNDDMMMVMDAGTASRYSLHIEANNTGVTLDGDARHVWRNVDIGTSNAGVTVPWLQAQGMVRVNTRNATIKVPLPVSIGGALLLATSNAAIELGSSVMVGGDLSITSTNGSVRASGSRIDVRGRTLTVSTTNSSVNVGELVLARAGASAAVSSTNGTITISEARIPGGGMVAIKSSNASIEVTRAVMGGPGHAALAMTTSNAKLLVGVVPYGTETAETAGTFAAEKSSFRVEGKTSSGSIRATVVPGVPFDWWAKTSNASVKVYGQKDASGNGMVGSPASGNVLDLKTSNSTISIDPLGAS